ncbi:MAG: hypothetical protein LBD53_10635, partial [Tannerella sp.]|nr:hypothetical protein [Tannerella sp.]
LRSACCFLAFSLLASYLSMTDVSSKPLAGFKTTARVLGTVITFRLGLPFLLAMTNALYTNH